MVVSGGFNIGAVSSVEKTTTFSCFGILIPVSWQIKYTDMARRSTDATIPSGLVAPVSKFFICAYTSLLEPLHTTIEFA